MHSILGSTIITENSTTASTSIGTSTESSQADLSLSTDQKLSESTTITLPITEKQENENTTATGAVIGGVAGSLLVLALFLLLLLALVLMTRKYKRAVNLLHEQKHPEGKEQREATHRVEQQHQDNEDMEMKSNDAYISTTHQIPTEDNVAYAKIECDHTTSNDQCEYDYI